MEKNDKMRKIVFMLLTALTPCLVTAQNNQLEVEIQADIVSKSLWRGQDLGGVSLQPKADISWNGIYLNATGSTGFDASTSEYIDVYVGYRAPFGVNISAGSHWMKGLDQLDRYFYFKSTETGHRFEVNLGYTNKYFSLQAYTTVTGNDFKPDTNKRAYSTYVELNVPFRIGGFDWLATAGFTPMESSGWYEPYENPHSFSKEIYQYYYADGFSCVQAALRVSKNLSINDFGIPVFVELNTNPFSKKAAFVAGFSLKPFQKSCCKKNNK